MTSKRAASVLGLMRQDDAVTSIEYALLAFLIAVTCVIVFQATGLSLAAVYEYWSAAVGAAIQL